MKTNLKKMRKVASVLSNLSENRRNIFLDHLAKIIEKRKQRIINANKRDVANARKNKLSQSFMQRLILRNI